MTWHAWFEFAHKIVPLNPQYAHIRDLKVPIMLSGTPITFKKLVLLKLMEVAAQVPCMGFAQKKSLAVTPNIGISI